MQQPSIRVRNLLETAVLQIQHSPDLSEEEVRWIQQFAAHLIMEFGVLNEPELLYAFARGDFSRFGSALPRTRLPTLSHASASAWQVCTSIRLSNVRVAIRTSTSNIRQSARETSILVKRSLEASG